MASDTAIESIAQEPPFLKFPPFPEPPPGVTIMPFSDFKARGIRLFSEPRKQSEGDEDAELDALGIPTVELRIKHATDECKTGSRKKRKKKKPTTTTEVVVKKLHWYEEWEEGEDLRVTKVQYDAKSSPADRFFQAAFDFRTGRPWPPISSGLNILWDQFRLFTGLLINPSVFRKTGGKKTVRAESPDFESDEEDGAIEDEFTKGPPTKRPRPDQDDEGEGEDDPQKTLDEEVRDEKIAVFLHDPEKAVRIFLSSFMREHGLIWGERNLVNAPRLVSFFLAFVLRNRVFAEPKYQRGLKRALEMIEWAKKELPLTHAVGQCLPDAINEACRECFGRKGGMNWSVVSATTATEQKDATIAVTDMSTGTETPVVLPTEEQTQLKEAIEDNMDVDVSLNTSATAAPNGDGDEWGNGGWDDSAWGDGTTNTGWAQTQNDPWADGREEVKPEAEWPGLDSNPTWNRDPISLISLLGPSVFPLTHTTGVVECSTRRVTAIRFPPGHPKGDDVSVRDGDETAATAEGSLAAGVEQELDARFAKVILEPWGREEGDISRPEIWNTSRGPVVGHPSAEGDARRKPHDPLKDTITLLVTPSFAETLALVPGLGLNAMWIEIARQDANGDVDKDSRGKFWYHEDVTGIFPSFYTPRASE